MNQFKFYELPKASEMLGVSYKTIRYYAEHANFKDDPSLVMYSGSKKFVSDKFLEKVKYNMSINSTRFRDPRSKEQLIEELDKALNTITKLEQDSRSDGERLNKLLEELTTTNKEIERLNGVHNESVKKLVKLNEALKEKSDKLRKAEKRIKKLESEDPFEIEEGKRVEVFTDEEYSVFEQRLREWHTLHKEMRLKDEHFMAQLNTKDEMIAYARQQSEYHRQQADKQLEQMDKLLGYLKDRNTREAERARIEAVEKNVIPRADGYDPYGSTQR